MEHGHSGPYKYVKIGREGRIVLELERFVVVAVGWLCLDLE